MKIDNIKFNDSTVDSLSFNGQEVTKLVMPNGDYWEKGSSSEPVFHPTLFMVDTGDCGFFDVDSQSFSVSKEVNGANFFVVHFAECRNVGTVSATVQGGLRYGYIDNFALFLYRADGYGNWPGGSGYNSATYVVNISAKNNNATLNFLSKIDEDNSALLRGDLVGKAFRVPASGVDEYLELYHYPYAFSPTYYTGQLPLLSLLNIGYQTVTPISINGTYSNGKITISAENGSSVIDYRINYKLEPNNSNSYREYVIVPRQQNNNWYNKKSFACKWMIHIIQEPKNKNRIYYSPHFLTAGFDDSYYHASTENKPNYQYHCFFETCSSEVIVEEKDVLVKRRMYNEDCYFAFCNSSDYEITSGTAEYTVLSDSYMWGDLEYTFVKVTKAGILHFARKSS